MNPAFQKNIPALTTLRMFAAVWVVFFHFAYYAKSTFLPSFWLVKSGYLGVDFFFVLSGFVLSHVYSSEIENGKFNYWMFMAKRFGRIYPLHLVTLILSLVLLLCIVGGASLASDAMIGLSYGGMERPVLMRAFIANLTLIHAWGSVPRLLFNLPSWSISAEWFAYACFPIFILLRGLPPRSEGGKLAVAVLFFLSMAVGSKLLLDAELTRMTWNIGILRIVPEFFLGMALHRFGESWSAGKSGSTFGFAVAVFFVLLCTFLADRLDQHTAIFAAFTVLGLAGIVLFAADASRYGRLGWLGGAFGVYLGEISYSIYMLHWPLMEILYSFLLPSWRPSNAGEALLVFLLFIGFVVASSAVSYKLLEVPARSWIVARARTLGKPQAPPVES